MFLFIASLNCSVGSFSLEARARLLEYDMNTLWWLVIGVLLGPNMDKRG